MPRPTPSVTLPAMCYSLYLSTNSPADLRVGNTELLRFQKAEDYAYKDAPIIKLLQFANKWFVGSKSECSCTFRHLHAIELGFGAPEPWYPEAQDELDATQQLYDAISTMLSSGHRVECIDTWTGTEPKDIKDLPVSLASVPREAFRLFENHRFVFA